MQINLVINETSLQIDEIESLPSYNLNSTGEYTNKSEDTVMQQIADQQQQNPRIKYRPLSVLIYKLTNVTSRFYFKVWISENDAVMKTSKKQECLKQTKLYEVREVGQLSVVCPFMVPLEVMQEKASQSDYYQVLINLFNEDHEELGWVATNLYFQQKLYLNRLFTETFKPPMP